MDTETDGRVTSSPGSHPADQAAMRPDLSGFDPSRISDVVEDGCRAVYGRTWDGPPEKMPGPEMKRVWRDLVAKAQAPALKLAAQRAAVARPTVMCPWDLPDDPRADISPKEPCPVCGRVGTSDAEDICHGGPRSGY